MKKTLLLIMAMTFCFNMFCQTTSMGDKITDGNSFSNKVLPVLTPANGDSLSLLELQQLNMQLRVLNEQFADYRTSLAIMSHRRQSSLIQALVGSTASSIGYVWLSNQRKYDNHAGPYVLMIGGGVLCISSVITWICSYTPLANGKVKVAPNGVIYNF